MDATRAAAYSFPNPINTGVCEVDPDDTISEADEGNNDCADTVDFAYANLSIDKTSDFDAFGNIITIAGNGSSGYTGDGGPASSAQLNQPNALDMDSAGNIYVVDTFNHVVRRIDAVTGIITTFAGDGTQGFSGDGGNATNAQMFAPLGIAIDSADNVYISDSLNERVRRVDAITGTITTYAGGGGSTAEGVAATSTSLGIIYELEFDASDNLYISISDPSPTQYRVRVVDAATKNITTVAGNNTLLYGGDGGPATSASVNPYDIDFDSSGNMLIGARGHLRSVESGTNIITTVAGTTIDTFNGDNLPALYTNMGIAPIDLDSQGNIYFGDSISHRVRRIDADTQLVTTIAGTGVAGYNGDNIPASTAQVNQPIDVLVDDDGNIYFVENAGHRLRMIEAQTAEVTAGESFNWRLTVHNTGTTNIALTSGDVILRDTLPSTATYGSPSIVNNVDVTGIGNVSCGITSDILTCYWRG